MNVSSIPISKRSFRSENQFVETVFNALLYDTTNRRQRIISLGRMLKWNQSIIPKEDLNFWHWAGCITEEVNKMSGTFYTATLPKFKSEQQTDDK